MKIVRTDAEIATPLIDDTLRNLGHDLVLLGEGTSQEVLTDALCDADLVLTCYAKLTGEVLDTARRLKGIVKYGVGIDAIDIPAANARGIRVVNIPEYAEDTVAEGAFALMIALAKKIVPLDRAMKQEGWVWPAPQWLGSDISGKTVGIIGFGRIGRSFARMAGQGFRANVLVYDPRKDADELATRGVQKCDDLHEMLGQCDFLSIHTVLNGATRHLIDRAAIAALKPGAIVINSSRGAIIDEIALLDGLTSGHLGGAGLDVYSQEPLNRSTHPLAALYSLDNVILSPHLTFYTADAMRRLESETLQRCVELIEGRPLTVKSRDPRLKQELGNITYA